MLDEAGANVVIVEINSGLVSAAHGNVPGLMVYVLDHDVEHEARETDEDAAELLDRMNRAVKELPEVEVVLP